MFRKSKPKVDENPYSYLLKILGSRDYSRSQLEFKLQERGHSSEKIRTAIENLSEMGLFKEDSYADARVRAFLRKGYGPSWIKSKLRMEKVSVNDALIERCYEYLGFTEQDQVRELIRKAERSSRFRKERDLDARKARGKLMKNIIAKGHSPSIVNSVLRSLF